MFKEIKELEFIGESLPTINSNFNEARRRLEGVEGQTAHYASLSSFYATHTSKTELLLNHKFFSDRSSVKKFDVLTDESNNSIDIDKVIYPFPIYVTINFSSLEEGVGIEFSYKFLSNSVSKSIKHSINPNSLYYTFTFMDLGFAEWNIKLIKASFNLFVHVNFLYLK